MHLQGPSDRSILNADSTSSMVGCVGARTPVTGVDTLRIAWAVRALNGDMSVIPVIQYARVRTDRPGDWAVVGGAVARTQNGDSFVEANELQRLHVLAGGGVARSREAEVQPTPTTARH